LSTSHYQSATYVANQSIGYLMRRSAMLMRHQVESVFSGHGLSFMQWASLLMIRDGLALTAAELSRQLDYDSGALTRLIDQLESRGLVRRERCEADRRQVYLKLTPIGLHSLEELMPLVVGVVNRSVEPLTGAELQTLISLLSRLVDHLDTLPESVKG
jgi:DNA-binding MarR family transcriptional regulator